GSARMRRAVRDGERLRFQHGRGARLPPRAEPRDQRRAGEPRMSILDEKLTDDQVLALRKCEAAVRFESVPGKRPPVLTYKILENLGLVRFAGEWRLTEKGRLALQEIYDAQREARFSERERLNTLADALEAFGCKSVSVDTNPSRIVIGAEDAALLLAKLNGH